METLYRIEIPSYNSDEFRIKSKLNLGMNLSELDIEVLEKEVNNLKIKGKTDSEIKKYLSVKYPGYNKYYN